MLAMIQPSATFKDNLQLLPPVDGVEDRVPTHGVGSPA